MAQQRDRQMRRLKSKTTESKRAISPVEDSDDESGTLRLAIHWWRETSFGGLKTKEQRQTYQLKLTTQPENMIPEGENQGTAAARMWRAACNSLVSSGSEDGWQQIVKAAPSELLWHSLHNCVNHQAVVWQSLLDKGIDDVMHPAAFKLAIVLRHIPFSIASKVVDEMLLLHPHSRELTAYILALLTDDEPVTGRQYACGAGGEGGERAPAPLRDLLLYGDLELCILGAARDQYDVHAKRVRAEYAALARCRFPELRIKVLSQFDGIRRMFQSPEFKSFEAPAKANMGWEVRTLRNFLLKRRC